MKESLEKLARRPHNTEIKVDKSDHFEKQWNRPKIMSFPDGEIWIYRLQSVSPSATIPLLYIPGWNTPADICKRDVAALAEKREVIVVDSLHGIKRAIKNTEAEKFPTALLDKVAAVLETLDALKVEKVDGLGSSEGGAVLTIAAKLYPERFRNLVLEMPAGLIGQDTLTGLIRRFSLDVLKSRLEALHQKELAKKQREMNQARRTASARFNLKKAWQEAEALANIQLQNILADLKKTGHGVTIIVRAQDCVFPVEKMRQTLCPEMFNCFLETDGRHTSIRTDEEVRAHAASVCQTLEAMERKNQTA